MFISTPSRADGARTTSAGLSEGLPEHVADFVRESGCLLIDGEMDM